MSYSHADRLKKTNYPLFVRLQGLSEKDFQDLVTDLRGWVIWDTFCKGTALSMVPLTWIIKLLQAANNSLEALKSYAPSEAPGPAPTKMSQEAFDEAAEQGMCWCPTCRDFTHDDPFESCPACFELVWPAPHAMQLGYISIA